jgi:hypothetical protein
VSLLEIYRKYVGYQYWNLDLQVAAYRTMDRTSLGNLLILFIVITSIFVGPPLLFLLIGRVFKNKGYISPSKHHYLARILIGLLIVGLLCAINATNNIWVAAAN